MTKINVAILTHNDEPGPILLWRLGSMIYHGLSKVAVLDDFSDFLYSTFIRKLCNDFNFSFLQRRLDGDFSAQKNAALDMLPTGEWVLQIDADEVVTPSAFDDFTTAIEQNPGYDSFVVWRHNVHIYDDLREKITDEQHIRLFKNQPHIRFKNKIHEAVHGCVSTGQIPDTNPILHVKPEMKASMAHRFYDREFYQKGIK
jgi:hypothetical protein